MLDSPVTRCLICTMASSTPIHSNFDSSDRESRARSFLVSFGCEESALSRYLSGRAVSPVCDGYARSPSFCPVDG